MTRMWIGAAAMALGIGAVLPAHAQIRPDAAEEAPASCTEIDIAEVRQRTDRLSQEQRQEAEISLQQADEARTGGDRQRCAQILSRIEESLPPEARRAAAQGGQGRQGAGAAGGSAADRRTIQADNVVAAIQQQQQLSRFSEALQAAGLAETLRQGATYTVFAPTDPAFERLPQNVRDDLLRPENRDRLRTVLRQHIIEGSSIPSDAVPERMQPMEGEPILANFQDRRLLLQTTADDKIRDDVRQSAGAQRGDLPQASQQGLAQARQSVQDAERILRERGNEGQASALESVRQAQQPLQQAVNQTQGSQQDQLRQAQQAVDQARIALENRNTQQAQQALQQAQPPLQQAQAQAGSTDADVVQPAGAPGRGRYATVVIGDIRTGNGYVHGIDTVLLPEGIQDSVARQ